MSAPTNQHTNTQTINLCPVFARLLPHYNTCNAATFAVVRLSLNRRYANHAAKPVHTRKVRHLVYTAFRPSDKLSVYYQLYARVHCACMCVIALVKSGSMWVLYSRSKTPNVPDYLLCSFSNDDS